MSESDNEEDDKVYVFFTERAQETEGAAGKVLYSRVARVCKVSSLLLRAYLHLCGPCTCMPTFIVLIFWWLSVCGIVILQINIRMCTKMHSVYFVLIKLLLN